jgi:Acyl-coenzyme A:6-aminopenicillanic acid acyl-transferase
LFHNAEMGPAVKPNDKESQLNILTASPGEHILHCNKYLRLKVPEVTGLIIDSSIERMDTFKTFKAPKNKQDVINMLGDTGAKEHCVFRDQAGQEEFLKTICVGIFDLNNLTWSIYKDNPKTNEPLVVLPLVLKK